MGGVGTANADPDRVLLSRKAGRLAVMNEVAGSVALQAVVGAVARTADADFNVHRTLTALAETAQQFAGASGVAVEQAEESGITPMLVIGLTGGTPRRLPIIAEGREIGFLAIYGAKMFGPATANRTQVLADLMAISMLRAARTRDKNRPGLDDERYRLITGVGLNLRNTLGAASGYLQLVGDGGLNEEQENYTERSRRAITAAVNLIGDLLELTRADAGKLTFEHDPVNMTAIAREAARKHGPAARVKNCEIDVDAPDRTPVLLTDTSHVQQIVDVLVYNAVRYAPNDSRISVTVDVRKGRRTDDPAMWVCLMVHDTGGGVEDADLVFEEVHRVERSKGNVRFKLAICRRVARLMGGDLTLDTSPEEGATFTLWLPAPSAR